MENALAALYVWFSLVLCVLFAFSRRPLSTAALALHVALSLGLAAHIAWRRLHWVPVEGEPIVNSQEAGGPPYPLTYYRSSGCGWRWTYGGVTYTAEDYTPGYCFFVSEKRDSMHHSDSKRTAQLFSAYSVSAPIRRSSPDRGRATGWRERRGVGA